LKFEFCSGLSVLLCGLFVSELMQGVEAFVKFEVRGGVVNTTLSCYDVIIDRDGVICKAVISSSFPPVSSSTDCFPLFVTATIQNCEFKCKCLVINNGSYYETCSVLEALSISFHNCTAFESFVKWEFTEDRVEREVFRHMNFCNNL
jgi:hypothetical protein